MARVLIIDDDPDVGNAVRGLLELTGHEPVLVRGGREAISFIDGGEEVDLILTDIVMPEVDGLEVLRHLREARPQLPVVVMTAYVDAPYLRIASLFGAKVTLHKPFQLKDLEAAIEKALTPPEA